MVHLAIAVRLLEAWPVADSPSFFLGSLAPDSIHMRPGITGKEKAMTHFRDVGGKENPSRFWEAYSKISDASGCSRSFGAGYAAHIWTDWFWFSTASVDFKHQVPSLDQESVRKLYYLETDQVDFDLYRQAEWRSEVWEQLARAPAPDFPPILSAGEIDQWRSKTLHWFDEIMQEPKIVPRYITVTTVTAFIEDAAKTLADLSLY